MMEKYCVLLCIKIFSFCWNLLDLIFEESSEGDELFGIEVVMKG